MRLIDAEEIERLFNAQIEQGATDAFDAFDDALQDTATVDAVPVVRCKDCVRWDDDPDTYGTDDGPKGKCMKSFETMCADDFCSYGERKDEANES